MKIYLFCLITFLLISCSKKPKIVFGDYIGYKNVTYILTDERGHLVRIVTPLIQSNNQTKYKSEKVYVYALIDGKIKKNDFVYIADGKMKKCIKSKVNGYDVYSRRKSDEDPMLKYMLKNSYNPSKNLPVMKK
ncbi:MAG: hypothetical protein COA79_22155 [Planctomycetota bacterium]|nr:MAG: hypothetical protein COA79_22155 [Planctomycetota bacterium]